MSGKKTKIYKPAHEEPGNMLLDFILLPYGDFYEKTKVFLKAKTGDILRFFNGPDYKIVRVVLIDCDEICNMLALMRYGISWEKCLKIWVSYARMEGHGPDIISKNKCIFIVYDPKTKM